MKSVTIAILLMVSFASFADVHCSGNGVEITVSTTNGLSAEIMNNGDLVAQTTDVSDISAFDIHYIGNFDRSSFDLRVNGTKGVIAFDNYQRGVVKLQCQQ